MWAAIKGDVSEFISTVKTETAETLNKIDHNLDGDDAPSTPMIDPDTGIVIDDENETVADTSFSREEMLHYIHSCPQVFMDPLPKQEEDENEKVKALLEVTTAYKEKKRRKKQKQRAIQTAIISV